MVCRAKEKINIACFHVLMLNKIFGFKRNEVTRGRVEWHGVELRNVQNWWWNRDMAGMKEINV